jgi:hypothetical protein
MLLVLLAAVCLAGCGSATRLPAFEARGSGSLGGCTDTWTGAAGDRSYTNPANWSGARAPGAGDFGCIQPGAVVNATKVPLEPAAGLVSEGTLCLDVPVQKLAPNIYNGPPPGQPALPQLPGTTDPAPADCPAGTQLMMQGVPDANHNEPAPSAPSAPSAPTTPSAPSTPATPSPPATQLVD